LRTGKDYFRVFYLVITAATQDKRYSAFGSIVKGGGILVRS
jgi:hypothetical protein